MSREDFIQSIQDGYVAMSTINLNESRTYELAESEASTLHTWEVNV